MERATLPNSPKPGSSEQRGSATPQGIPKTAVPDLEDLTFANIENSVLEMFDRQISTTGLSKSQREAVNEGLKRAAKQITASLQVGGCPILKLCFLVAESGV